MDTETCGYCGGRGTVECDCTGDCGSSNANSGCSVCGGSGKHTCPACNGIGYED